MFHLIAKLPRCERLIIPLPLSLAANVSYHLQFACHCYAAMPAVTLAKKKRFDFIELKGSAERVLGKVMGLLQVRTVGVLVVTHPLTDHPHSVGGMDPNWKVFHGQCF